MLFFVKKYWLSLKFFIHITLFRKYGVQDNLGRTLLLSRDIFFGISFFSRKLCLVCILSSKLKFFKLDFGHSNI